MLKIDQLVIASVMLIASGSVMSAVIPKFKAADADSSGFVEEAEFAAAQEAGNVITFGQASDMAEFSPMPRISSIIDNWAPYYIARTQAVIDGTAPVETVASPGYTPALDLAMTYYWRVDEVEADGTVHAGDVWTLTATPLTAFAPHRVAPGPRITSMRSISWMWMGSTSQ